MISKLAKVVLPIVSFFSIAYSEPNQFRYLEVDISSDSCSAVFDALSNSFVQLDKNNNFELIRDSSSFYFSNYPGFICISPNIVSGINGLGYVLIKNVQSHFMACISNGNIITNYISFPSQNDSGSYNIAESSSSEILKQNVNLVLITKDKYNDTSLSRKLSLYAQCDVAGDYSGSFAYNGYEPFVYGQVEISIQGKSK